MAGLFIKEHKEAFYSTKERKLKLVYRKNLDMSKEGESSDNKKIYGIMSLKKNIWKCFRCGKYGYFARDCKVKIVDGNLVYKVLGG